MKLHVLRKTMLFLYQTRKAANALVTKSGYNNPTYYRTKIKIAPNDLHSATIYALVLSS